ncbi:CDP-glycerol glycerophosphotransferase family protein [Virgibacillus ndiopensis]|uniref:CDP-glycerol glycerophosphotransferase family protein n=1 Tax=Virgibacillus ndiopensis TaxID=2004408 RepID=UPI000C081B88|nr:CDP-glycerol glycerophosphotransferase family protein [Virgibacillus ndiopensis]
MIRELAISIYLFLFQLLFNLFKLFPQRKKTVCVTSFGDNIFYTTKSLRSVSDEDIIVLKTRKCDYSFDKTLDFDIYHPIAYLQSIYHLATATTILVDNYFGFLAVTEFKEGTTCIQLWHAAGALKQFGLMDPSNRLRSKKANDRFQRVYNRFDYTVVGSEKMATIFRKSFGVTNDSILRTGIPRTDFFFNYMEKRSIIQSMKKKYPIINEKKVILYAPTFRDNQLNDYQLALDIKELYQALSDEYVLFVKLHPAVQYKLSEQYDDFVYDVSDYQDTNQLLLIADLLISDYSSIPFEYALLQKPMIFYAYDLQEYQNTRGLLVDYLNQMPGPVVSTTEAIIQAIEQNSFDKNKIKAFAQQWNEYSVGGSSVNITRVLTRNEENEEILV